MRTFKKVLLFFIVNLAFVLLFSAFEMKFSTGGLLFARAEVDKWNTLILGESQGEAGVDPVVISEEMDVKAYSLARSMLPVDSMIWLIREAHNRNPLKYLFLEVDPGYWLAKERDGGIHGNQVLASISPALKLQYATTIIPLFTDQCVTNIFAPYSVSRTFLDRVYAYYIKGANEEDLRKIGPDLGIYIAKGRGFRYGISYSKGKWWENLPQVHFKPSSYEISDLNRKAFKKIKEFCDKNSIKIITFQTRSTPRTLHEGAQKASHAFFTKFFHEFGLTFYDLNYVKSSILAPENKDFVDGGSHPMGHLAVKQTKVLCDILKSDNPSQFFYKSYDEVLANLPPEEKVAPIREKTHD